MRVSHIIPSIDPRTGGPMTALLGLAKAQSSIGMRVTVVASWTPGEDLSAAQQLRRFCEEVVLVGPCSGKLVRHPTIKSTAERLVGTSDVLHIHALWEDLLNAAAVAARQRQVPYVITPHGMLDPWSLQRNKFWKRLYMHWRLRASLNGAAAVHYTANTERDLAVPLQLRSRAVVIPNGLDAEEFVELPHRGEFRANLGVSASARVILFLGRLHPKKGLEILLPAFAKAGLANTRLIIAGPDANNYKQELERLVVQLKIAESVVFAGMLNGGERIKALVDADVLALTSFQENFGIVVLEALACGTPVIISDQVNIWRDMLASGSCRVTRLSVDDTAVVLADWGREIDGARSDNRELAASRAREWALNTFDWRTIARRWGDVYTAAIRGE